MAAAMRGCEYEYVAERERGLQTVARTSSYRYRYALPLCVLNGGLGLFFNPAPALTELSLRPKIIGAHMAEISIQEIEASAHASAIATGGHGPFSACGELYARNRKGAESKARFSISISIAISDCDIAQKMLRVQTSRKCCVCREFHVRNRNG